MKHSVKYFDSVRHDWPFWNMKVGDYFHISGKDEKDAMKNRSRGMSAASHYKRTRGFHFKSVRIERMPNTFAIIRIR